MAPSLVYVKKKANIRLILINMDKIKPIQTFISN